MIKALDAVIERDSEEYYIASVPELSGCHTQARSLARTLGHPCNPWQIRVRRVAKMKADVVYEPLWGNTAGIAHAIAAGPGLEARALFTAEATFVSRHPWRPTTDGTLHDSGTERARLWGAELARAIE